jgi:type II secretory pathway component PulF
MSSPPLPATLLEEVLSRLSIALAAGVDVRRAMASEAARVPRRWRPVFEAAAAALGAGEPLAAALGRTAGAVPADVLGMVAVGDRTGRDAETLRDVAAALGEAVAARRSLVAAVVPAALRLAVALGVIGLLILISGSLESLDGRPLDMLGLGLTGLRGLTIYAAMLVGLLLAALVAVPRLFRSWQAHGVVRRLLSRLPLLGPAARAGEAARWCRAAALAAGAGLDAGGLVGLASRAAPGLALDPHDIEERLRQGDTLAEALAAAGRLPTEVIDAVGLGELSGTVAESLGRLVPEQLAAARRGYAAAVGVVGAAAWVAVAGLVVLVVFRVMGVYVGILQEAGRPL